MNKYLKILALTGGIVGAIAPTAVDMDKQQNNDLGYIYESVEKMQEAIPRLSRINYKLNIDLTADADDNATDVDYNTTDTDDNPSANIDDNNVDNFNDNSTSIDENDDNTDNASIENNALQNTDTQNRNTNGNITFVTTDELGNETNLTNQETINYLSETLIQTNAEYEQLKTTLTKAIQDTMDYLDAYRNGETTLSNEQKIYIKQQSNSIKFLAETLEDLSEEVICAIDGCAETDEDFEEEASKYLSTIEQLESRIQTLYSALSSLQFINNVGSPYFYAGYRYAPNNIHTPYSDQSSPDIKDSDMTDSYTNNNLEDLYNTESDTDNSTTNNTTNNINKDNIESDNEDLGVEEVDTDNGRNNNKNNEKPTTFGLKSNIDTYAPTKRNIDTFFNTALYNNDYMYGYNYGNGMPYGYGGGYGYGMPYNAGYYGHPYGMSGLNSNIVNREVIENQTQANTPTSLNPVANVESDSSEEVAKPKKMRIKRAKNIDTYTGTTIQSNINTMGESKISNFFKEKFNTFRDKIRKQKDNINENKKSMQQEQSNPIQQNIVDESENSSNPTTMIEPNVDTYESIISDESNTNGQNTSDTTTNDLVNNSLNAEANNHVADNSPEINHAEDLNRSNIDLNIREEQQIQAR